MSIFKRIVKMVTKPKKRGKDPHLAREAQKYETPVPSREYILEELEALGPPMKMRALSTHFQLQDEDLREAFRRRIKAMIRDGQLMKTPEGFFPITEPETCEGVLQIAREGEGTLLTRAGQKIQLGGPTLRGYFDGDEIRVQIIHITESGESRGRIIDLIKPVVPQAVGRLIHTKTRWEVIPFDRKLSRNIMIKKGIKRDAQPGDIVLVKIHRDKTPQDAAQTLTGEVQEILGDPNTPGIEIEVAIRKFDIPHTWSKALLAESKAIAQKKPGLRSGRRDLTHLPLLTIDGEDAKDFDDAVYCEPRKQGGWHLTVAIADVSHYVTPGSALDEAAQVRGNSTYFPGMVIPMLPEVLSNGLCSLKPNELRYCMVCTMNISATGEITRYEFYRGLMESKARLTYTEVAEILNGHDGLREKWADVVPALETLKALYTVLYKQRRKRGAIDFDTVETKILFGQQGKIQTIMPTNRNIAHKMIEESMLAANVCAAKFLEKHECPTLYRVHDRPPTEKLTALREFLAECGLDLGGRAKPTAKDFTKLMTKIQDREDRHVIETVMLRSLSQAQYHTDNVGHFGLAYDSYCHFTSPIRRYPDLLVHRAILALLKNPKQKPKLDVDKITALGMHCSQTERRSDEATRDATMALKCHYMQEKVGSHFRGVISGVASFGLFIELKDIYVEGLVHVTALGNEYFQYDPVHHRMVGDRTRTIYRLGDSVNVQVMRVDVEAKKIDLELVDNAPSKSRNKRKLSKKPRSKKKPSAAAKAPEGKAKKSSTTQKPRQRPKRKPRRKKRDS